MNKPVQIALEIIAKELGKKLIDYMYEKIVVQKYRNMYRDPRNDQLIEVVGTPFPPPGLPFGHTYLGSDGNKYLNTGYDLFVLNKNTRNFEKITE